MLVVLAPSLGSSDAQVRVRTAHVYPLGPEVPLQAVAGQASQSHQYLQIPPREAPTLLSFQVNSPAVVAQYVSLGSSTGWGGTQLRRGAGHGGSFGNLVARSNLLGVDTQHCPSGQVSHKSRQWREKAWLSAEVCRPLTHGLRLQHCAVPRLLDPTC